MLCGLVRMSAPLRRVQILPGFRPLSALMEIRVQDRVVARHPNAAMSFVVLVVGLPLFNGESFCHMFGCGAPLRSPHGERVQVRQ